MVHDTIENNEITLPITNHQAVATTSIGAGIKRAHSKKKRKECLVKANSSSDFLLTFKDQFRKLSVELV